MSFLETAQFGKKKSVLFSPSVARPRILVHSGHEFNLKISRKLAIISINWNNSKCNRLSNLTKMDWYWIQSMAKASKSRLQNFVRTVWSISEWNGHDLFFSNGVAMSVPFKECTIACTQSCTIGAVYNSLCPLCTSRRRGRNTGCRFRV